jgi:arachidonate 5-lipoxygenase
MNRVATIKRSGWSIFFQWLNGVIDRIILWVVCKLSGVLLAIIFGVRHRERMSHNNGIGGRGTFTVVSDPAFPAHDFFKPGRMFPCRIRHASVTYYDDAMNTVKGMGIKLADHHLKSPFDMEMNTGAISFFWSAASFINFARMRKPINGVNSPEYFRKYPITMPAGLASLRRAPTSFFNLRYYSKSPFLFIGTDGVKRYVKYLVMPFDNEPETGLNIPPIDLEDQRISPGTTVTRNYLKEEYQSRVKREGAKYRVKIQLRVASDDDDPEIFNNCAVWDEDAFPYVDLAVIEITETLDWNESNRLTFLLSQLPKSLAIIPARSIYDYNSMNYMRVHTELAGRTRLLSYKLFGMPPEIPDDDNRNSDRIN